MANDIKIRILDFFTKPRERSEGVMSYGFDTKGLPKKDGTPIFDDWVSYCPPGQQNTSVVHARIDKLRKVSDIHRDNPAYAAAKARWDYIRPAYEAWKSGEELPEGGTPLASANFLQKEFVAIFKRNGVRTLEELIDLSEVARDKLQIPRVRELQKQAKAFLEAQDQNKVQAELEARDQRIAALEERLAAMEGNAFQPPQGKPVEKRGPGRPAKAE